MKRKRSNNKILELFAGSRSVGKAAEKLGWQVFSSDIKAFDGIDYVTDIFDFDVTKVPFKPDVIWASPPCTGFSIMAFRYHWTKGKDGYIPKSEMALKCIAMVKKTIELIEYFKPKYFYIENPRGMLRKMDFMKDFTRHTVTYCQYGDTRMKPTDIWTNNKNWKPKQMCRNGAPCHEASPRGSRNGTLALKNAYERSKIPEMLCTGIMESCEGQGIILPFDELLSGAEK